MQDFKMIQRHLIATILLSVISQAICDGADVFSYKDAKNCGKKYSQCNGKQQSPVILDLITGDYQTIKKELSLTNFRILPKKMTIENTGHTVEMRADWSGKPPKITGGPLNGTYVFEKATFHWAKKAFIVGPVECDPVFPNLLPPTGDMEIHMFFYKTDLKSFKKAQSQKGGLAVLKMLLQIEHDPQEHIFDNLEKNLHKVQSPNSKATIDPIRLPSYQGGFVPFFTFYEGSLDYPPCLETVLWFIDDSPTPITKNLVKEFRKIKLAEGDRSNLRPAQELNDREPQIVNAFISEEKDDKHPKKLRK